MPKQRRQRLQPKQPIAPREQNEAGTPSRLARSALCCSGDVAPHSQALSRRRLVVLTDADAYVAGAAKRCRCRVVTTHARVRYAHWRGEGGVSLAMKRFRMQQRLQNDGRPLVDEHVWGRPSKFGRASAPSRQQGKPPWRMSQDHGDFLSAMDQTPPPGTRPGTRPPSLQASLPPPAVLRPARAPVRAGRVDSSRCQVSLVTSIC